ncbi:MAG: hypothetical protein VBE63_16385 [Lamprobacter sp.]|uniref:hypothetical protein n=1 Tax=Lamprobacter sp. TaxID=3100796 RepID=UPI002B25F990|nr:hypothetical protein [Lamprobacter sp.]MEA3641501.1 hypothetical protein [Lamprobacter sp.]
MTLEDKRSMALELIGLASIAGAVSDSAQALIVEIGNRLGVDRLSVMEAAEIRVEPAGRHARSPTSSKRAVPVTSLASGVRRRHLPQSLLHRSSGKVPVPV